MTYKQESYLHLGETMVKKFRKRGMEAFYCQDSAAAIRKVEELIPEGASVAWGGSETLEESGVMAAVRHGNYHCIDRKSAKTPEEARALYGQIVCSDYYLMSTNAFTLEGELVNIDGNGNRVACLIHGPAHVIVVTGMNKATQNVEAAIQRVHQSAAPPNCVRLQLKTPCAATGMCSDCQGEESICCQVVVTRRSRHPGRITIVMVGEDLGF